MKDGMNAEPSWSRQAIRPVSLTATLAMRPRKMPATSEQSTDPPQGVLTCDDPELPEHDESTSDAMGGHLGREDGDRCVLRTDANTHDETCREQSLPGVCKGRSDGRGSQAQSSHEDLSATTEVVVKGVDNESATGQCQSIIFLFLPTEKMHTLVQQSGR